MIAVLDGKIRGDGVKRICLLFLTALYGPDKFHASVFCTNEVIGTDEKRMGGKVLHSLLNMLIRN